MLLEHFIPPLAYRDMPVCYTTAKTFPLPPAVPMSLTQQITSMWNAFPGSIISQVLVSRWLAGFSVSSKYYVTSFYLVILLFIVSFCWLMVNCFLQHSNCDLCHGIQKNPGVGGWYTSIFFRKPFFVSQNLPACLDQMQIDINASQLGHPHSKLSSLPRLVISRTINNQQVSGFGLMHPMLSIHYY